MRAFHLLLLSGLALAATVAQSAETPYFRFGAQDGTTTAPVAGGSNARGQPVKEPDQQPAPSLAVSGIPAQVTVAQGTTSSWTISASGMSGTPVFTATGLPDGVTMTGTGTSRTVSGSPTGRTPATATITVTDPASGASASQTVSFTPLYVTDPGTVAVTRSVGINRKFASSAVSTAQWSVSPALPNGFALAQDGTLPGDPSVLRIARTGPYTLTVTSDGVSAPSSPMDLDVTGTVESTTSLPFMTSNTASAGHVATASTVFDPSVPAWKAFDGLTLKQSSGQNTFWAAANNAQAGAFLKRQTPDQIRVGAIILGGRASDYGPDMLQGPGQFTFQGSNDDANWTNLVSASNLGWGSGESKTFTIPVGNRGYYRYHRVASMTSSGSSVLAIDRLDFLLEK